MVRVIRMDLGMGALLHLQSLGLRPGMLVRVVRPTRWRGPVTLSCMGTDVAVGRGVAERIWVEACGEEQEA